MDTDFFNKMVKRHVIDNRKISMIDALKNLLTKEDSRILDIAVGYFYISGMLLLKKEFINFMDNQNGRLRILMGNETNGETVNVLDGKAVKDYAELIHNSVAKDTKNISDTEFLSKVNQWIESDKMQIKVYTGKADYFHAKSYLFAANSKIDAGIAIVGSSNFSKKGLQGNTELNFVTQDGYAALHEWYSNLWLSNDEVTDFSPDLIKINQNNGAKKAIQEYKPVKETYYDFANMYGKPYVELDEHKDWVKGLYPHQRTGVVSVKEKLDTLSTAVLSDGVGLGKTRTAAGVIRLYLASQAVNKILVVADTKLEQQWHEELNAVGVSPSQYSYLSRQKLVGIPTQDLIDQHYTLIIVDEAHIGFKNNNTEAYQKLLAVKQGTKGIKGLMLTATPWNNEREDVINIGSLFLNVDAIPQGRDYKKYFMLSPNRLTNRIVIHLARDDRAFREFWSDVYLQRTRKTYGGKVAMFPHREFPTVEINYEPRKDKIFSNNFEIISELKFPYQDPIKYIDNSKNEIGAQQLKMMLLKRADSSWVAFRKSIENIIAKLNELNKVLISPISYLKGKKYLDFFKQYLGLKYDIIKYEEKNLDLFKDFHQDDQDSKEDDLSVREQQSKYHKRKYIENLNAMIDGLKLSQAKKAIGQMSADCQQDLDVLNNLIAELDKAYQRNGHTLDEKMNKIIECVDQERTKGHKIILVSQFADTVRYYYQTFYQHYNSQEIAYPMGMITGAANNKDDISAKINQAKSTKEDVLEHFSPISKNNESLLAEEQINLIIATDTISTGQNLQDAVTLMNIDLPYNPMTLEQRIGRIDRPVENKVKDNRIYIYTFPIYESINSQLKMLKRLGNKMEGVLSDTEFDNVVLPEYEGYLQNIKDKKANAVKEMLDNTDKHLLYPTSFASEKHSEAYREANKRMYNFRVNQLKPLKNPLVKNFSFSNGRVDHSVVVAKVSYYDVNNSHLGDEQAIISPDKGKIITITDAERYLNHEINYDLQNSQRLNVNKALLNVQQAKDSIHKVVDSMVEEHNKNSKFVKKNITSLNNKTAQKAAQALDSSARNLQNTNMIMEKLKSVNVDPQDLGKIISYIQTITPDDGDLFLMVKDIANNPNVFWLNINDYSDLFNPKQIKEAEEIGKNVDRYKTSNDRLADKNMTKFEVLTGNLVIKDN